MSANDATMCANYATMSAKDATMGANEHNFEGLVPRPLCSPQRTQEGTAGGDGRDGRRRRPTNGQVKPKRRERQEATAKKRPS